MEVSTPNNNISNNHQVRSEVASREDIQAAFAKAAELRAIHTALFKGTSSTNSSILPSPPFQRPNKPTCSSANDYPVFTPSYEEEPLPGYQQLHLASQALKENWGDYAYAVGEAVEHDISQSDNTMENAPPAPRKGYLSPGLVSSNPPDDQESRSMTSSCSNHHHMSVVLQNSPLAHEVVKLRRRNSLSDLNSVSSSFNRCRLSNNGSQNWHKPSSNTVAVPLTDSHRMVVNPAGSKRRGVMLSWLFPRLKKKEKSGKKSPEGGFQIARDKSGVVISVEALKEELLEAKQMRDLALGEAEEMRCSIEDLKEKLENLEKHCEELEKGLAQGGVNSSGSRVEKVGSLQLSEKGKSCEENDRMPVSEEVMVEGFVQIVSEARLSVKNFCKQVVGQLEEAKDEQQAVEKHLNCLLQPYKLSVKSEHKKSVVYHLEAIVNRALYEDFENCIFQKNGTPKLLDPQQARLAQFSSFVGLRNLSWNEVLKKGTKYYSAELSKFCDQKMSSIISTLGWNIPWPEQLLQSFFVAAKCIWLLHLLAFSFSPPLTILRVEENRPFDSLYMEDMLTDRQRSRCPTRVKIMAMPGFYVQDRVLKCKVLCSYR